MFIVEGSSTVKRQTLPWCIGNAHFAPICCSHCFHWTANKHTEKHQINFKFWFNFICTKCVKLVQEKASIAGVVQMVATVCLWPCSSARKLLTCLQVGTRQSQPQLTSGNSICILFRLLPTVAVCHDFVNSLFALKFNLICAYSPGLCRSFYLDEARMSCLTKKSLAGKGERESEGDREKWRLWMHAHTCTSLHGTPPTAAGIVAS